MEINKYNESIEKTLTGPMTVSTKGYEGWTSLSIAVDDESTANCVISTPSNENTIFGLPAGEITLKAGKIANYASSKGKAIEGKQLVIEDGCTVYIIGSKDRDIIGGFGNV